MSATDDRPELTLEQYRRLPFADRNAVDAWLETLPEELRLVTSIEVLEPGAPPPLPLLPLIRLTGYHRDDTGHAYKIPGSNIVATYTTELRHQPPPCLEP